MGMNPQMDSKCIVQLEWLKYLTLKIYSMETVHLKAFSNAIAVYRAVKFHSGFPVLVT